MSVLIGLVGAGIQLSRTPLMHEKEAEAQGFRLVDKLIDTAELDWPLPRILEAVRALGFDGINVTHPFKQEVIALLDDVDERAQALDAVNTVVFRGGEALGFNTDYSGYARALRGLNDEHLARVVQFGAGGAGNATAQALIDAGARELIVVDPDQDKAQALAAKVGARVGSVTDVEQATGVVNATPCGMSAHPHPPFPTSMLRPQMWVSDVVYMPLTTQLLADAQALGCHTISGRRMAVGQAADAFQLFTGREANISRMDRVFESVTS